MSEEEVLILCDRCGEEPADNVSWVILTLCPQCAAEMDRKYAKFVEMESENDYLLSSRDPEQWNNNCDVPGLAMGQAISENP